jgi:3-oxoacyl-[acyl-carrier protein] reductase
MIRRGSGTVVNVSSLVGSIASPTTANYGASKAALEAWSFALRAELRRFGVHVSVFVAPHTDTEMGRRIRFDGVYSLPVAYTTKELLRAIDRAPRKYAASPVYRLLLWLARMFPASLEARVGKSARTDLTFSPTSKA